MTGDESAPQPWETEYERSGSGQPVYRHEAGSREFEPAIGDESLIGAIDAHLDEHLPGERSVLHEIISDLIHVDIHVAPPTDERPCYTLVTSGMAERPMAQPEGVEGCQFSELMLCLPPDWPGFDGQPIDDEHPWTDEANYWPIKALKFLARMPHEYQTWLWAWHTVPTGDPPEPFGPGTDLCCAMLMPPVTLPEAAQVIKAGDRDIHLHGVVFLHTDEMQLKLDRGAEALVPHLEKHHVHELLDPTRGSVLSRPWWKFW